MAKDEKKFTVKGTMDIQIKYDEKQRLELARSLRGKQDRIEQLRNELKVQTQELKAEIKGIEKEITSDIATLECGVRHIPAAPVDATLNKESRSVTISYNGMIVSEGPVDPEKHKGLFGELAVV